MKNRATGFTLIEVLVAIAILAIAALSFARLQLANLRIVQQSIYRSLAIQLASEMAEMMRATAGKIGDIEPYLFDYYTTTDTGSITNTCYSHPCQALQYAAFTVRAWQLQLKNSFPQSRAVVCRDATPWRNNSLQWACDAQPDAAVVVKIGWPDKNDLPTAIKPKVLIPVWTP